MLRYAPLAALLLATSIPMHALAQGAWSAKPEREARDHVIARSSAASANVIDLNVNPADGNYLSSGPPAMSFCQTIGCNPGHTYASHLTQVTTRQGSNVQEVGQAVNMTVGTGYSATLKGLGAGVNNGKVGEFIGVNVQPGAGHVWGQATDVVLQSGVERANGFASVAEFDLTNDAYSSPPGNGESNIFNIFVGGIIGKHTATAAMFVSPLELPGSGPHAYYWGLGFTGTKTVKDATIFDSTSSAVSLELSGAHRTAVLRDQSTSPVAANLSGSYSFGAVSTITAKTSVALATAAGQGVCLNGTKQCLSGTEDAIQAASFAALAKLRVPFGAPASSKAPCVAGQMQVDTAYIYTCAATNTWHRVSNGSPW